MFVRAGSILPIGEQVQSTAREQGLAKVRVYPGRDARFTLYDDDGTTNAWRTGGGRSATLVWDDARGQLSVEGRLPTGQALDPLVMVIGR